MSNTLGHSIENWLRRRQWSSFLTYWGLVFTLIGLGFAVGYGMTDKHPYVGSLLFLFAVVLLIAGGWHTLRVAHRVKWTCTAIAFCLFGVGDYFWVRSLNQPVPWIASYIASHAAWTLVFVLGVLLVLTFVTRPKKAELQRTVTAQKETTTGETSNQPLALPESRPRIVAVSYSRIASIPVLGLVTANDGEPAYKVSIPPVKVGSSIVTFGAGTCPRIGARTSTEWRVLIKQETGGMSTGNDLRNEMQRQSVAEIHVPVGYEDGDGLRYISHCWIELDSSQRGGLTVRTDRQELVSGKPRLKDSETFPDTGPRPYLEVEDPIGEGFGKTLFHFTNRGGEVAHKVQVQPVNINRFTVVFDSIPFLPVNQSITIVPTIPGIGINGSHELINRMVKEWEEAWEQGRLASQDQVDEWKTEILVTYEDFAKKRFEMTCVLSVFPLEREFRDRNAFQQPRNKYKTVEVSNIKFRVVP